MNRKYPRGKLNEEDQGQSAMAIGIENNVLVIHFQDLTKWIGLDKKTAKIFVKSLSEKIELMNDDH